MNKSEAITVFADGQSYEKWEQVVVVKSIPSPADSFELTATELLPAPFANPFIEWNFPPGTAIDILANGDPLLTGAMVYDYLPEADAESHSVRCRGSGQPTEIALASADTETGHFEGKTVIEIAKELAKPLKLNVKMDGSPGKPIPYFAIRQGSTPWHELMRILPQRALLMTSSDDGHDLVITDGKSISTRRHAGSLIQGRNIKRLAGHITGFNRFSETIAKGQISFGTDLEKDLQPVGRATDKGAPFERTKVIIDSAETSASLLKIRAEWESNRAIGASVQAIITTYGFRDEANNFWQKNYLVFVYSPFLKLDQDMLIVRAEFRQDSDSGTVTELTLVDPRTYGGDGQDNSGSGDFWNDGFGT